MAKLVVKEEDFQYWHTAQLSSSAGTYLPRKVIQYIEFNKSLGTGFRTQNIETKFEDGTKKSDVYLTSAFPGAKPEDGMKLAEGGHGSSFGYDGTDFYIVWKGDLVKFPMAKNTTLTKAQTKKVFADGVKTPGSRVVLDKTGTGKFLFTDGMANEGNLKFTVTNNLGKKEHEITQSTLGILNNGQETYQSTALAYPLMAVFTGDSNVNLKAPTLYIYDLSTNTLNSKVTFAFPVKGNIWDEPNARGDLHHEAETVNFIYPSDPAARANAKPMVVVEFVNHSTKASDPVGSAKTHRIYVAQMHEEGKEPTDMYYGKQLKQANRTYTAKSNMNVYKDIEFTTKTGAKFSEGDSFKVIKVDGDNDNKTAAGTPRLRLADGSGFVSANVNFSSFNDINENQA
ncbi:DUF5776 domain-containing protein [Lysinibacillus xylanilyticus]|uniref:DUF5776 domain-containing protein n=1 Tax=Lysinibacillus xylanilyticus TaxID=582475 RepID=UPI003D04A472